MNQIQSTVQRSRRTPLAIVGLLLLLLQNDVVQSFETTQPIIDQFPTKAPTVPEFAFPPIFLPTNAGVVPTLPPQQQVIVPTPFQISFPTDPPNTAELVLPTTAPTAPRVIFTVSPVATTTTTAAPSTLAPSTVAPVTPAPSTAAPITAAPITAAPISAAPVATTLAPTVFNVQVTTPETSPPTTGDGFTSGTTTSPPTRVPQTTTSTPPPLQVFPPNTGAIPTIPALTVPPTRGTTVAPTLSPTSGAPRAIKATVIGVTMTFEGITSELSRPDADWMGEEYAAWFDDYFNDASRRRRLQSLYGVTDMVSGLDVTAQDVTATGNTMTFTQSLDYTALPGLAPPPEEVVLLPFQTPNDRIDLVNTLQREVMPLRGLQSVSSPTVIAPVGPEPQKGDTWATPSVIAAITGGCALLVGTLAFAAYCCCGMMDNGKHQNESTASESPLQQFQFGESGDDNVSAFDADTNGGSGFDTSNSKPLGASSDALSVGNFGEQSVATVDYDYTTAYGGGSGAASVVSSVGGTLGDATRLTAPGGTEAPALGASYEAMRGVQEEVIVIEAPPGKLGVVIDTPDDGAPLVHAVKDSSVIADLIQVGDKLLAVDDDDVQTMTAIKVSKLISRRSGNPVRKLTIVRTTHVGAV